MHSVSKFLGKRLAFVLSTTFTLIAFSGNGAWALDLSEDHYELKLLGKYVFFDKISEPSRMACSTCHDPETGWTGSVSGVNLHQVAIAGANAHTRGQLKPPSNAYASLIPPFEIFGGEPGEKLGGNFWDGRAEGNAPPAEFPLGAAKHIGDEVFQGIGGGDPTDYILEYAAYFGGTADQALNPMPNIVEQNISRQSVCRHVESTKYSELYVEAWGQPINCSDDEVLIRAADVESEKQYDISFKRLMLAVCAWQHSAEVNSFSSRRDLALASDGDGEFPLDDFTDQENLGHDLFYNLTSALNPDPDGSSGPLRAKRANCRFCHRSGNRDGTSIDERYTDDEYKNIGTPVNFEIPGVFEPAPGLAGHTGDTLETGLHKTPTLRNVDKRKDNDFIKAYAHNGWFKSLESLVHFYNTADVDGDTATSFNVVRCPEDVTTEKDALALNCWPAPAVEEGSSVGGIVGDLGLTLEEEAALVAYLKTFTDTVTPTAPKPYKSATSGKKR